MEGQVLDAPELRRRGVLRLGVRTRGVITWVDEAAQTTAFDRLLG
jgi:hypothetical protein